MNDLAMHYLATWNAVGSERDRLLAEHWAPDVLYVDPLAEVTGTAAVSALIDSVQAQFPDSAFFPLGQPDGHHDQVRFSWGLGKGTSDPAIVGFDVVVADQHGRIAEVRGFLDRVAA